MKQNAVIVYVSRTQDLPLLFRSITLLGKNWKFLPKYPIVVFHDDITKVNQSKLLMALHESLGFVPNVKFELLTFQLPEWVSDDPKQYTVPLDQAWMGYRHMCRFHSGGIYQDPRLAGYDYYMRLDSDSYIYSRIDYDVFEYMADNSKEYAFMATDDGEVSSVIEGLWDSAKTFMDSNSIAIPNDVLATVKNGVWEGRLFYTNFEIAKFSFFRGEKYTKFFEHLDKTGNFFYKRWGDAPVHWLAVKILLDPSRVWAVDNITYQHNAWIRNLRAVGPQIPADIMKYVDGDEKNRYSRKERLVYALKRFAAGGPDFLNWGE